jgi:hypothetical protein
MAPQAKPLSLLDRLKAEMAHDRKKATLLVVLAAVGLLLGVRLLLSSGGTTPAGADAAQGPPSSAAGAGPTAAQRQMLAASPELLVGQALEDEPPARRPLRKVSDEIGRDLFLPKLDQYVRIDPDSDLAEKDEKTEPAFDAEEHQRAVLSRAKQLKLQTILIGPTPKAVINGRVVGSGDWIAGFEVVGVRSQACVLQQEGVRVRLDMPVAP